MTTISSISEYPSSLLPHIQPSYQKYDKILKFTRLILWKGSKTA